MKYWYWNPGVTWTCNKNMVVIFNLLQTKSSLTFGCLFILHTLMAQTYWKIHMTKKFVWSLDQFRIKSDIKAKADIFISIEASPIGKAVILVIISRPSKLMLFFLTEMSYFVWSISHLPIIFSIQVHNNYKIILKIALTEIKRKMYKLRIIKKILFYN